VYIDNCTKRRFIDSPQNVWWLCRLFDKVVIDGTLHAMPGSRGGISQIFLWGGDEFFIMGFDSGCEACARAGGIGKTQSGRVQNYFRVLGLGAAILLLIYFYT